MQSSSNETHDGDIQLAKMRQNLAKMDPERGPKRFAREWPKKKGPFWVKYQDIPEPLHWAASVGDYLAVKEFMCGLEGAKMISPNETDVAGRTPVMRACFAGNKECIDILVKDYYQTPRPDPVQLHLADNLGWNALFYAAAGGYIDIIQSLVKKKGFDIEHADIMGRTALHIASLHGKPEVVKYLITKGADSSRPDRIGRGPLHLAAAVHTSFLHYQLSLAPSGSDRRAGGNRAGGGVSNVLMLRRPPLPPLAFILPSLTSQKGKNLLDVLRETAAARRNTEGLTPWDPVSDTTTRQFAACRALVKTGRADLRARAAGLGDKTPAEACWSTDERLLALLQPPPAEEGEGASG